jgi:hypothetical protein
MSKEEAEAVGWGEPHLEARVSVLGGQKELDTPRDVYGRNLGGRDGLQERRNDACRRVSKRDAQRALSPRGMGKSRLVYEDACTCALEREPQLRTPIALIASTMIFSFAVLASPFSRTTSSSFRGLWEDTTRSAHGLRYSTALEERSSLNDSRVPRRRFYLRFFAVA